VAAQVIGPALAGIARSMFQSYSGAAFGAYRAIGSKASANNVDIGDFNLLKVLETSTGAAGLEVADLADLRKTLREVAPDLYRKLNRNLKKVGEPAQEKVQEAYKLIGAAGPRGVPNRKGRVFDKFATSTLGRLSWVNSKTLDPKAAVSLNFRNRNKSRDWSRIKNGQDGTLSLVRVSVNAPAFVVADIAGAGKGSGAMKIGEETNDYEINLFGRGKQVRTHFMTPKRQSAIWNKWIPALDAKKRAPKTSRYAWPAVDKHMPKYRRDTENVLNPVLTELNRRLAD
jgi:hypothetical protein